MVKGENGETEVWKKNAKELAENYLIVPSW